MNITEARAQEAIEELRREIPDAYVESESIGPIIVLTKASAEAALRALLAALPETPTTDDREALAYIVQEALPKYFKDDVLTYLSEFVQPLPEYIADCILMADVWHSRRQSPPTEEPKRTVTFANERQVEALFAASSDNEMVFVNAINDHLIVGLSEDGECFYQGVPEALNEEGTEVDPRRGWLRNLRELEWPLTLMVKAEAAARVGGEGS